MSAVTAAGSVAAGPAGRPPHLEHVAEVGSEVEGERHHRRDLREVGEHQPLVEPLLPQQTRALDMDDAFRRFGPPSGGSGSVGEVGGEAARCPRSRCAEERRRLPSEGEAEAGQDPGVVAEKAVALTQYVAECVRHDEGVVVLQREEARGTVAPCALAPGSAGSIAWAVSLEELDATLRQLRPIGAPRSHTLLR